MKNIFSKLVVLISGLTMSGLSLAQSYISTQQVFKNAQGQVYQSSNAPVTVYNSTTTLTPVYPEYTENVISTYNVPEPVYQQQQQVYTTNVVEDVLPWLLVGGAVAAITSYDKHDHHYGYHRHPPKYNSHSYYRPHPPKYKPHVNRHNPSRYIYTKPNKSHFGKQHHHRR